MFAAPAAAQSDRAQLSGRIKDAQGGSVPGATVTATDRNARTMTVVVSDSTGFFIFPNLRAGRYDVTAELQGFKKSLRQDVVLDAAGSLALDFSLETGAVTEEVTVTAESPVLQTDTSLRKTIESRDLEQLSFSGRNPIGVVGLKAGVVGGSFNNYNFSDLGNGGFSINGSRTDENNITVDGATAIRTRSNGAIVGIQNVDALQEVQVLTGDYMPEFGRVSGGQIRMVTKSGGNRFSGSGSFFYRDDSLQANTWTRNKSPNASENSGAAPFDYKQYAYSIGGPLMKDKLFFFAAQEWVNYLAGATNLATVPTAAMRNGDFSELLVGGNPFFATAQVIRDPLTGQPFPGNIIPANRLSPNGIAMLRAFPLPTPGFRSGNNNAIINSENPQDQRKDNIRFDYRLNANNQFTYRYGKYNWTAIDAFRGTFNYARTDWDRPNTTQTASWMSTLKNNIVNETSYTFSLDEVYINVLQSDLYKRSKYGINYQYLFPENKEIPDKIPDHHDRRPDRNRRRTVSGVFDAARFTPSRTPPRGSRTGTRSRPASCSSTRARTTSTRSTCSRFRAAPTTRTAASSSPTARRRAPASAIADAALGLFQNYAEIGQRALTKWRALATDIYVQDSWRPRSNLTIEGGVRYVLWPPFHSLTNNIATFDPAHYSTTNQAVLDSSGRIISGPRYNGIVLPGDGFPSSASDLAVYNDPAVKALFIGAPEGLTKTHKNVFEPRVGIVLRHQRQDHRQGQRRRVPQPRDAERLAPARRQPAVPAAGQREQRLDRQPRRRRRRRHAAVRHDRDRSGVQAPGRLHLLGRRAARAAVGLGRRRGLRRPAGTQRPARAQHQPAGGRDPYGQRRQPRHAASVQGLRRHPAVGERRRDPSTTACS